MVLLPKLAGPVCVLLLLSGCGLFTSEPGPGDALGDFLSKVASGDTLGAAELTDDPASAKDLLDKVRGALGATGLTTSVDAVGDQSGATAPAEATLEWQLPNEHRWKYRTTVELRREADDWKVHWAPSVVHPKLGAQQSLGFAEARPALAPVLDRDGTALMSPETVVSVLLSPKEAGDLNAVATALAGALSRFDGKITAKTVADGAAAVPEGQSYLVAALRDADYQSVKPAIYELPGVRFTSQVSLLAPSRDYGSQVLPAIRKSVEDTVAGEAGFRVYTANSSGQEVETLFDQQPEPAHAVPTTLSRRMQDAAEDALEPIAQPAMLVALKVGTGEVLAVAQNGPADEQGAIALTGQFPPGSTFKIVTAAAAMASGKANADSPLPCPARTTVDGRRIVPNDKEFDKGAVPLRTAFAFSCNTTFAQLAAELPAAALTEQAASFGLGVDFEIPAITTITGSVPEASDVVERAEDGFGQGKVVASPFGMALVAATAAGGAMPTPTLMREQATKADRQPPAPSTAVLEPLRAMMREVVESGTATQLRDLGDVRGKTGTAQYGDGVNSHGWFVGYRGDVAFATLLLGANASTPAVDATGRFLRATG
ncbi:penicillin-binding protein transpeptidase [Actinosynnema mirum DSM 43827]|uniref:Penicillin-binding protein transpeptidase n=1 Tax=Actinosynnema mirum (strain ATCC 29888 / DSM 43827 / JCM 3225 / NBRC 14064 / NCIMB 13271 / NRRL B-12336 / IMRU 3971 / 101) TaxID=446462 RepID=C6WES0_ACTMD|nr:penicillin-binding protein transpeptidase [Actinosynnema mirum DSM 43827]